MSDHAVGRDTFHKDPRRRGFGYQLRADGSKTFYGWVPGRGRVKLEARHERQALEEWNEIRGKGKGAKLPDRNVRFELVAEEWYASKRKLRRSTRELYRLSLDTVLLPAFGAWKLAAIDTESIAKLIRKLEEKPLSASTITNYLKPLNGTLSFAVSQGKLTSNPYAALTADQRPRDEDDDEDESQAYEWSDEEIERLLDASAQIARRPQSRYDYQPILRMAIRTGARLGELLGLIWKNVDLDEGVIHVRQQWTKYSELAPPKTKKSRRRIPLTPEDVAYLRRLKLASTFSQDDDYVFASRDGTPLSHRNVQRRGFEAARDLAELSTEITFHFLRHAFASIAAHRGVPVNVLSAVMGHSTVSVTQRVYVHLYGREQAEDDFRQAMARAETGTSH
jgi:integrase